MGANLNIEKEMKRIGIMSDTHGFVDPKVFEYFKEVDEIWHAGDVGSVDVITQLEEFKPVKGVFGNIDDATLRLHWPENQVFHCEDVKVVMTHIAGKPYKYRQGAYDLIKKEKPQIFVCGHSHILMVQYDKNINALWVNPGACGFKGFHQVKTLIRLTIDGKEIKDLEVIEIGPRA